MTSPPEPQTPARAEAKLASFQDALDEARERLAQARNAEVLAKQAYKDALRRAILSDECPRVGVTLATGERVTVTYRDAWAEEQVKGELKEYELATAARQAASDHFQTLRSQGNYQQSIASSVRESYRGTGGYR